MTRKIPLHFLPVLLCVIFNQLFKIIQVYSNCTFITMLNFLKASKTSLNSRLAPDLPEIEHKVKITNIKGKGRGLIAQQDFQPGDIIIANRALEIIFPTTSHTDTSCSSSLLNKVKRFRLLKESLATLIAGDEELRRKVYSLSAGPKLGYVDSDTKSITNGKCDNQSQVAEELLKGKVSMVRIEGVLIVNGFQGPSSTTPNEGPFGLWYLPAFINHDCFLTNANWTIINDFMFIRAAKSIRSGQEILISYIDPHQSSCIRNELFMKHNFICGCKLCKMENDEGFAIKDKRDEILCAFKDLINREDSQEPEKLKKIVQDLKMLRPNEIENPFVLEPLMHLGLAYYEQKCFQKAINAFKDAITLCKRFVQFTPVASTLSIAIIRSFMRLEDCSVNQLQVRSEVEHWLSQLQRWMRLQYGCNDEQECFELLELLNSTFCKELRHFRKSGDEVETIDS